LKKKERERSVHFSKSFFSDNKHLFSVAFFQGDMSDDGDDTFEKLYSSEEVENIQKTAQEQLDAANKDLADALRRLEEESKEKLRMQGDLIRAQDLAKEQGAALYLAGQEVEKLQSKVHEQEAALALLKKERSSSANAVVLSAPSITGTFQFSFGSLGSLCGRFSSYSPQGLVAYRNSIYVCDYSRDRIQVFSSQGEFVRSFGHNTHNPWGIAGDGDEIYVCDSGNGCIRIYDAETGYERRQWGKGLIDGAYALTISGDNVLAGDFGNNRVAVFGKDGTPMGQFVHPDRPSFKPTGIAANGNDVYVTDFGNCVIQVFSMKDGDVHTPIRTIGLGKGVDAGYLDRPWGVCMVSDSEIAVCDMGNHRVQIFRTTGEWVRTIGSKPTFIYPVGATFANGFLYIADRDNHKVHVYK